MLLDMTRKMKSLERQIEKIKEELAALGPLRMGSISEQYNVCGTPGCRCKATPPEKHGPYYQLSYSRKGKSTTRFVRKKNLAAVRKQLRNYTRLRELVDRWIDTAIELADLQAEEENRAQDHARR
jgi:hypothetical protein